MVAGLALHTRLGPPNTYWNLDTGAKALLVEHLRRDPGATRLFYPGRELDPELTNFPLPVRGSQAYGEIRDGEVVSAYLCPFVWMVLPFATAFGFFGLGILPALAGGVAVALTGALAAGTAGSERAGVVGSLLCAVASPLLFYSAVFWEHTTVTALAAGAFLALREKGRERAALGGVLMGAATFLREENGLLLVATGVALGLRARGRDVLLSYGAGGAIGACAHLLFQRTVSGSWWGPHVGVNRPVPLRDLGTALHGLLLSPGPTGIPVGVVVAALAALAAGALLVRSRPAVSGAALGVGGIVLAAISLTAWLRYPSGQDRALALIDFNSAAVFLPWALAVPFLPGRGNRAARRGTRVGGGPRFLGLAAALFVGAFLVLVPERTITGVHPAPRMLLPILPVVCALAVTRFRGGRAAAAIVLLGALAALWSFRSIELLHGKRHASGRIAAALQADPRRIVATDLFWLPTDLASLWFEKDFHLIAGQEALVDLAGRAAAAGESEMLVVVESGRLPGTPVATARTPGYPAFSVDLHVQALRPPPGGRP